MTQTWPSEIPRAPRSEDRGTKRQMLSEKLLHVPCSLDIIWKLFLFWYFYNCWTLAKSCSNFCRFYISHVIKKYEIYTYVFIHFAKKFFFLMKQVERQYHFLLSKIQFCYSPTRAESLNWARFCREAILHPRDPCCVFLL